MTRRVFQLALGTAFALVLGAGAVFALEVPPVPVPPMLVNDTAEMLTAPYRAQLESELVAYAKGTGNQIVVLTVPTLGGDDIVDFGVRVFKAWGIGDKEKDTGVLLLLAEEEHGIRIEVGYGAEEYITDGRAGEIIRNDIVPAFRAGNFDEGVGNAIKSIEGYLGGEPAPLGAVSGFMDEINGENLYSLLMFVLFFVLRIGLGIIPMLGRTKSFWLGGVLGALFGFFVGFVFLPATLIGGASLGVAFAVIGLLLDFLFSRHYQHLKDSGRSIPVWYSGGGWGSGGSSSGGGFGGFGGGSSGGGGASGNW